jgi:hypothetical protein
MAGADIAVRGVPVEGADRATRALTSTGFLGAVLAAFTWPVVSIVPSIGPDASWAAGLYMAHAEGLQFGREIVFTYGPLGFLQVPVLYDEALWIVAFLFQAAIHVVLAVSLLWAARRAFPLALAVAVCYCVLVANGLTAAVVLLAFIWCFVALGDGPPRFAALTVTLGGGVLAAVELLSKANYGIAIFGLTALTVAGLPDRRRNVPLFAAAALGALAACWVAAGQELAGLPDFASHTAQMASGYSEAMGTDIVAVGWERPAAIVVIGLLLIATGIATRRDPLPRRLASFGLVALFSLMTFKQGFVRQGIGSTPEFFVIAMGAGVAIATRLSKTSFHAAAIGLTAALAAFALAALPGPSLWQSLQPRPHLEFIKQDLGALLQSGRRARLVSEARDSMRSSYRLDPALLAAVRGRTVHIDPWEIGVAWAYGLKWRPLPVMQSYAAYTPELDRLNAAALGSAGAPATIIRHRDAVAGAAEASVDGRFPGWESPAAMRAMLCRYRAVRTTARWQLLEREMDRCGAPRPIGVVHSATGEQISIPPPPGPRDLVFARIAGIGASGGEVVRTALYRGRKRTATLDAGTPWQLVPATAGDGLIVAAPSSVDYPAPFRLAPRSHAISLQIEGAAPRPVTVAFFAQRVGRFPDARR